MSPEKLSPGAEARAKRDAGFVARFGNGAQPKPVVPKAAPLAQAMPYAAQEASKYEARFLKNLTNARDDFEWIKANEAWKTLGHESFTSWWETRVAPIMSALSMRPSRAVASEVVDRALADDAAAPEEKRRGTGKIAQLAGVDRKTVQRHTGAAMSHPETSVAGPAANPEGDSPVLGGQDGAATDLTEGGAHGRGLSDPEDPPAAELIEPSHAGVPAVGDQIEERIEEEAAEASADLPAAATTSLPDGDGNPMPEQSQQPGQDSPPVLGSEGFPGRAETDHHRAGVSGGEARVASQERATAEPVELEDGGVLPPESPSSSDPAVLLRLFAEFLYALDRTDIDVIAPLLLTEEMQQLHEAADRVATFVGLLETWRTP